MPMLVTPGVVVVKTTKSDAHAPELVDRHTSQTMPPDGLTASDAGDQDRLICELEATVAEARPENAGGVRSTIQEKLTGDARLPAGSLALTWNVCDPSASKEYVFGDAHAEKPVESSSHSKAAVGSAEVKPKDAVAEFVAFSGRVPMVAVGAIKSTTKLHVEGVASAFPTASWAFTSNLWSPAEREDKVRGDSQGAGVPISSWHRNLTFGSRDEKAIVKRVLLVGLPGQTTAVSGGWVSTLEREPFWGGG